MTRALILFLSNTLINLQSPWEVAGRAVHTTHRSFPDRQQQCGWGRSHWQTDWSRWWRTPGTRWEGMVWAGGMSVQVTCALGFSTPRSHPGWSQRPLSCAWGPIPAWIIFSSKMNELFWNNLSHLLSVFLSRGKETRGQYSSFTGFKATYIIPLSIPTGEMILLIFSKRLHFQPLCLFSWSCLDAPTREFSSKCRNGKRIKCTHSNKHIILWRRERAVL